MSTIKITNIIGRRTSEDERVDHRPYTYELTINTRQANLLYTQDALDRFKVDIEKRIEQEISNVKPLLTQKEMEIKLKEILPTFLTGVKCTEITFTRNYHNKVLWHKKYGEVVNFEETSVLNNDSI